MTQFSVFPLSGESRGGYYRSGLELAETQRRLRLARLKVRLLLTQQDKRVNCQLVTTISLRVIYIEVNVTGFV